MAERQGIILNAEIIDLNGKKIINVSPEQLSEAAESGGRRYTGKPATYVYQPGNPIGIDKHNIAHQVEKNDDIRGDNNTYETRQDIPPYDYGAL